MDFEHLDLIGFEFIHGVVMKFKITCGIKCSVHTLTKIRAHHMEASHPLVNKAQLSNLLHNPEAKTESEVPLVSFSIPQLKGLSSPHS